MKLKRTRILWIAFALSLTMGGCGPAGLLEEYFSAGDPVPPEDTERKPRVYMDELQGILEDFTGSSLTLKAEGDTLYTFDVSDAALECEMGMITGDEISVIYEGVLTDGDTSGVKALKVVDEYYHKHPLEDQSVYGQLLGLTSNTITIRTEGGNTVTFPITGARQYYENGIRLGGWLHIHYKGSLSSEDPDAAGALDGSHVKVLSISDVEPLEVPSLTPDPTDQQLKGRIRNIKLHSMEILLTDGLYILTLDLSSIPSYFSGGLAPGSLVTVNYEGEFDRKNPSTLRTISVVSENVDKLKDKNVASTVSGTIIGSTANTVTIRTADEAVLTCYTSGVQNTSTGGMEEGDAIKITFHPAKSRESNIYTGLKIEDAS